MPELPAAGKAIVGGNLSIMGSSGLSHVNNNSSNPQALAAPRTTQLNGTLAFTTLGLSLPWSGNFSTSRLMAWSYKPDLAAFATQVAVDGVFEVQNTATGDFMLVNVTGFVNLFSTAYPGPGFTGKYQLAGDLTLSPNPFSDAGNDTAGGVPGRKLAGAESPTSLAAPVQGAVAVREQRIVGTTGAASGSGTSFIDPDGSVVVEGEVPYVLVAPWLGMPCAEDACDGAYPYEDAASAPARAWPWKGWFNVDALLGGLIGGLAFCGFVAAALVVAVRGRRKAKRGQQQSTDGLISSAVVTGRV
jgi:hypothetical protein